MSNGADCACGCSGTCGGAGLVPATLEMAVGDPAVYRTGAIATRMKDAVGRVTVRGQVPLAAWTTRDPTDPGIALIEAQAQALHVLAWNANRVFLDGTLPQGNDRKALVQLAALLGHEPRPALSATAVLSFDLDDLASAPEAVVLAKGRKVSSVPKGGDLPQVFETDTDFEARKAWNRLVPVRGDLRQQVTAGMTRLVLAGSASGVKAGDTILAYAGVQSGGQVNWLWARVTGVDRPATALPPDPPIRTLSGQIAPTGMPAAPFTVLTLAGSQLVASASGLAGAEMVDTVIVLGDRGQAFGATAPDLRLFDSDRRSELGGSATALEWLNLRMTATGTSDGGTLDLGELKPLAAPGRVALFAALPPDALRGKAGGKAVGATGPAPAMAVIGSVDEGARKDFGVAARATRIAVTGVDLTDAGFNTLVRQTMIHLETGREALQVVQANPILPTTLEPDRLVVVGEVSLPAGRPVIVGGVLSSLAFASDAPLTGEIATLTAADIVAGQTTLIFTAPLANRYHADRLEIHGNCVQASQGESQPQGAEMLGSSDPVLAEPRYVLRTAPVAHVPAPGPRGYAPALTVRVGARDWALTDSLLGKSAAEQVYRFRAEGVAGPEVQFAGPLPGGAQAVTALYRKGGGLAGNIEAGRITTLLTPAVGVRGVINPLASTGGADAEAAEAIRQAAPAAVRTMDRVVSAGDYQAFAQAYRGIGKALASDLRLGMRSVICLTIATTEMGPPVPGSDLETGLHAALLAAGPPGRALRIDGFTPLGAAITLGLACDPAFDRSAVEADIRATLGAVFAASQRDFARALTGAEVIAAAQAVPGVLALRLDGFTLADGTPADQGRLLCPGPQLAPDGTFFGAGLLSVDPALLTFAEMLA